MKKNKRKLVAMTLAIVALGACQDTPQQEPDHNEPTQKSEEKIKQDASTQTETSLQTQKQPDQVEHQIEQNEQSQHVIELLAQEEKSAIEALEWVQTVDLEKEYSDAIQKKDFRVWVIANRASTMPGVDSSIQAEIDKNCGHKYLPGVGDTLRGETHRAYRKKAVEYAKKYNQKIQAHCLSIKQ